MTGCSSRAAPIGGGQVDVGPVLDDVGGGAGPARLDGVRRVVLEAEDDRARARRKRSGQEQAGPVALQQPARNEQHGRLAPRHRAQRLGQIAHRHDLQAGVVLEQQGERPAGERMWFGEDDREGHVGRGGDHGWKMIGLGALAPIREGRPIGSV